jgi:hypothetical protein
MIDENESEALRPDIAELVESIKMLGERENAHYTDVMLKLNDLLGLKELVVRLKSVE